LKLKNLLLIAAFWPVALTGCSSTGADTVASFDLAPGDPALPDAIALEPGRTGETTGKIVAVTSVAAAPQAAQAAAPDQAAAGVKADDAAAKGDRVAVKSAGVTADPPEGGEPTETAEQTATAKARRLQAMPKSARLQPTLTAETTPLALAAVRPTPAVLRMGGPAVKAVAAPADLVTLPVTPASYVKADRPLDSLIAKYAAVYQVPVELVRHVVKRESNFNPSAFNGGHYGLMQIKHATARGMGYLGPARGLFDAETNLKYAVKYLRGAFLVADGNMARADRLYQTGYYYHAKRKGLLDETGLGRDRERRRKPAPELP
jgi:soluble lytic murein transglycosylase-like protein